MHMPYVALQIDLGLWKKKWHPPLVPSCRTLTHSPVDGKQIFHYAPLSTGALASPQSRGGGVRSSWQNGDEKWMKRERCREISFTFSTKKKEKRSLDVLDQYFGSILLPFIFSLIVSFGRCTIWPSEAVCYSLTGRWSLRSSLWTWKSFATDRITRGDRYAHSQNVQNKAEIPLF